MSRTHANIDSDYPGAPRAGRGRPGFPVLPAATAALLLACGGHTAARGAGLEVAVKIDGVERATVDAVTHTAAAALIAPAEVELVSSASVAWTWARTPSGVQVEVEAGTTATAWRCALSLPPGVAEASLDLTGRAQDGSGQEVVVTLAATAGAPAARGAYTTGAYPDLFAELLGKSEGEVQAKIDAAWGQLFGTGPDTVFYAVDPDQAYILDTGNGDIRSEGMSYAMMIAVELDHRPEFDRLWRYARTRSLYASGPWKGYFAWALHTDGTVKGASNASDGEEWYATALLMAANRWGNAGAFDYRADAQAILDTLLHKHEQADRGAVTDMFDAATHQVVFVAEGDNATFTDPSYHLPHFYALWSAWADKDRAFWCSAAAASRVYLSTAVNATTGLAPDYSRFDGAPYNPSWNTGGSHADFRYDAFRVASNVGVDHLWFDEDRWQVGQSDRLLRFFHGKGTGYPALWKLDGTPLGSGHGAGLTGMNAAAALAASDQGLRTEFVQALWDTAPPTGTYRYYDGLLYFLGLLEVSGRFRVIHPAGGPVEVCR
jgi:oligosaccharide reducing-end xylanase